MGGKEKQFVIALIAHDGMKPEMVQFVQENKHLLSRIKLVATGTTGGHVENAGLAVERLMSGPKGGDAQIASRIAEHKIDAVFFFRDPLDKHPHEPDIQMLMRLCDVHDIPLATNPASATLLLKGLSVN